MRFNADRKQIVLHAGSADSGGFLAFIPSLVYIQTGNVITHTGGSGTAPIERSFLKNLESCFYKSSELTQFTRQAKVNNLDFRPSRVYTDNVLRLEVQVDDVLLVDILHALQDLLHVAGTGGLRVLKVVIDKAFKEFAACNTGPRNNSVEYLKRTYGVFLP